MTVLPTWINSNSTRTVKSLNRRWRLDLYHWPRKATVGPRRLKSISSDGSAFPDASQRQLGRTAVPKTGCSESALGGRMVGGQRLAWIVSEILPGLGDDFDGLA